MKTKIPPSRLPAFLSSRSVSIRKTLTRFGTLLRFTNPHPRHCERSEAISSTNNPSRLPAFLSSRLILIIAVAATLTTCTKQVVDIFGSISGVITDSQTKQPLAGVTVTLNPLGLQKVTAANGAYSFDDLDPLEYTLTFAKTDYVAATKSTTVLSRENAIVDVALQPEPKIPVLAVSATALDFGEEVQTLSLHITNTGKGELNWQIKHEQSWFTCSPLAGVTTTENSTVVITVSRNLLQKGAYQQTFSIASNGGNQDITLTMTVPGANLTIEPNELDFGTLTASLPLTIKNNGTRTVNYTAATTNSWIVLGKTSGQLTTSDYFNVMVNRGALPAGTYSGQVNLVINSGNETVSVPVKMNIVAHEKPEVGTPVLKDFSPNSANVSSIIVSVGSQQVTRYGFCWNTSPSPTVSNSNTNLGTCSSPIPFENILSSLTPNTKYYVRAYAENGVGLVYSPQELVFTTKEVTPEIVPVSSVSLNTTSISRQIGDPSLTLTATVLPSNATNKNVSWQSSNPNVAIVSNGVVSFVGAGYAIITVSTIDGNKQATCSVLVSAPTYNVSSISLNQTSLTLTVNENFNLSATITPLNATNPTVTWSSSNTAVATVSPNGLNCTVTAKSNGSATIYVTTQDGNKQATCAVSVITAAVAVTGVTLNAASKTINIGEQFQLTPTISPANASNKNVTYSSSNTSVAIVSSNGLVTAQAVGTATITVKTNDGNKQASCLITVTSGGTGDFNISMVYVAGGTFTMGGTDDEPYSWELPTHSVTLSSFYIGKYEVTQKEWLDVMGSWPGTAPSSSYGVGDNYPAYYVSWNDIVGTSGSTQVINGITYYSNGFIYKLNQMTGKQYRLPTEAEWEYAARGGASSQGYKYSGSNTVDNVAWYSSNSGSKAHAVGTKQANELGIYDMNGNVWEWCADWYGSYSSAAQTNPTGPTTGSSRVDRGGGWDNLARNARVSGRYDGDPAYRYSALGFRVACSP